MKKDVTKAASMEWWWVVRKVVSRAALMAPHWAVSWADLMAGMTAVLKAHQMVESMAVLKVPCSAVSWVVLMVDPKVALMAAMTVEC